MIVIAHLGHLLTCLLAIYVGIRVLRLWTQTRKIPELSIGVSVLSIAIGGVVFAVLEGRQAEVGGDLPILPSAVGVVALAVHIISTYIGTWQVYRPQSGWAKVLVVSGSLVAVSWAYSAVTGAWMPLLFLAVRGGGMVWAALEAFHYSAMLRRRIVLGLAEPMMAHRIWLWGVGATAQTVVIALDSASWIATGASLSQFVAGVCFTAVIALIGSAAVALAFFPPRAYARMVTGDGPPPQRVEAA